MFSLLTKIFRKPCYLCNKRIRGDYRSYINDHGKQMKICLLCTEYAERRAYRKAQIGSLRKISKLSRAIYDSLIIISYSFIDAKALSNASITLSHQASNSLSSFCSLGCSKICSTVCFIP